MARTPDFKISRAWWQGSELDPDGEPSHIHFVVERPGRPKGRRLRVSRGTALYTELRDYLGGIGYDGPSGGDPGE